MNRISCTANSATKDLFPQAFGSPTSIEAKTKMDRQEASLRKMVRRARAQFNCHPASPSSLEDLTPDYIRTNAGETFLL